MSPGAVFRAWLPDPLPHEVKRPLERIRAADDVQHVAVMPDVHHAGNVSIGVVLGTTHMIYPEAVGGDIGCGICAAPVSASASSLTTESAGRILRGLYESVPLRRHHSRSEASRPFDEAALDTEGLSVPALRRFATREGVMQFGGLGSGNHFLELQADEEDGLWVMIHSGSRALGQAIRDHHLHGAHQSASRLIGLDANTEAGQEYLRDEAPAAYKDIEKVMRAQKDLTRIVRRLRPVLVYKGR